MQYLNLRQILLNRRSINTFTNMYISSHKFKSENRNGPDNLTPIFLSGSVV